MKTPAQIADAINFPVEKWPGQCSGVANSCLQAKVVRGRLCYGHYVGPIAQTGHFAGRPFAHHAWIELRDGRIWDPTRWVFEDVAPYIYIGPNDHYDFGGNAVNAAMRGAYPDVGATERPTVDLSSIPAKHRRAIGRVIEAWDGTGKVTPRQAHWLGNVNIFSLPEPTCRALFKALIAAGHGASIPVDNRQRIMG